MPSIRNGSSISSRTINDMKLIKSSKDHTAAVKRLEELMLDDPASGSEKGEELELLAFLIEDYEKRTIEIPAATPVEAIRFRMEQEGLKQQDLVPFIGSKSRVSEVLSGKRELTLAMVRKLHQGLDIPLKSLVQDADDTIKLPPCIEPDNYPVKEMFFLGYFAPPFGSNWSKVKDRAEELLQQFFNGRQNDPIGALNRQTTSKKSKVDLNALHAWRCRVLDLASEKDLPKYDPEALSDAFIRQLTALSPLSDGPLLVQRRLQEAGVAMIVERHIQGTHLDGAAMWHPGCFPVIALTVRYDRLDNFWFTLFHELGHVVKHLGAEQGKGFLDTDIDSVSENQIEREADQFALNAFVSDDEWDQIGVLRRADDIVTVAKHLAIHPSIIAGRLRREAGDYRKYRTLIGQGEVRKQFGF